MNRELKFRAWHRREKRMWNWKEVSGYYFGDMVAQKHAVLMQYTGLKDKNGKEIYEGDIMGYWGNACWVVAWDGKKSGWGFRYFNESTPDGGLLNHIAFGITNAVAVKKSVIGNIYENPELLEQRQ